MTWMLDERARPIPVRAERAGSLEIRPTSRMVGEVIPLVPRESDAGRTGGGLLADEQYCFCPDDYSPQTLAEEVLFNREEYAEMLRGACSWHFWWD